DDRNLKRRAWSLAVIAVRWNGGKVTNPSFHHSTIPFRDSRWGDYPMDGADLRGHSFDIEPALIHQSRPAAATLPIQGAANSEVLETAPPAAPPVEALPVAPKTSPGQFVLISLGIIGFLYVARPVVL